jgi:hypothetical protein
MPDWTYVPLRRAAERVLGPAGAQRRAMGVIRRVARLPGGSTIIRGFDYTHDHAEASVTTDHATFASPIGVVVDDYTADRETAFRAMGYGFIATRESLPSGAIVSSETTIEGLVRELNNGARLLAANDAIIANGPCVAQRINEIMAAESFVSLEKATEGAANQSAKKVADPQWWHVWLCWRWPAWTWALWLGIAMVCAGIGATIITVGPVLLGYDRGFLGASINDLRAINPRLVLFLQHDRITMAGCMMAIGFNDVGFALAMRRGWRWARAGFLFAGALGFPTFFLFLGYRFFDPLHFAVAAGFFPLFLMGVFGRRTVPSWRVPIAVNEPERTRALYAQALMVAVSLGVLLAGYYIMSVGLRSVLIPTDREYMNGTQSAFRSALNGRLLRFVAHDRAGFGGALSSLGGGLLTTTLWGWRAGERSTWWMLLASSVAGFGAALSVHFAVGYTDSMHLLPVYLGVASVWLVLHLSQPWFFRPVPAHTPQTPSRPEQASLHK